MATQTTNYGLKKPSYSDTADIGVINSNMDIIDAKMKEIDDKITNETDPTVPAWAKEPNKPTYTAEEVGALPNNTPIPDPTSVVVDRLVSVGTHIADISVNGEKTELYAPTGGGGTSVAVDSELSTTSENPVQNKVITQELNRKGTYSKPTGGIPKTDLSNEVQTSLGKADTALQEHQDISGKADKTELTAFYNSISDVWNSETVYEVGQYCIHNNILWKCLVANTNIEPTEGTHWTQTTIDAEITSVNSSLTFQELTVVSTTNCTFNGSVYKCGNLCLVNCTIIVNDIRQGFSITFSDTISSINNEFLATNYSDWSYTAQVQLGIGVSGNSLSRNDSSTYYFYRIHNVFIIR